MTPHTEQYLKEVRAARDEDLHGMLAGWKPGTECYLIAQYEIEQRREARRNAEKVIEDRPEVFRKWLTIGIAFAVCVLGLLGFLYK